MTKAILTKSGKSWIITILRSGGNMETVRFNSKDAALRYAETAGLSIGRV